MESAKERLSKLNNAAGRTGQAVLWSMGHSAFCSKKAKRSGCQSPAMMNHQVAAQVHPQKNSGQMYSHPRSQGRNRLKRNPSIP